MSNALSRPQLESEIFVPARDPRTKRIRSVSTLHNLNVGVVEQKANLIVSGDARMIGAARLEGGATGVLNYPDGTLALVPGTGVNLTQRRDGKVVIDAIVDTSDLTAELAAIPGDINALEIDIAALENSLAVTSGSLASRLTPLESGAASFTQSLAALSGSVATEIRTLFSMMNGVSPRVVAVEDCTTAMSSSLDEAVARIDALEAGMESVRSRASGVGTAVEMNAAPSGAIDGSNVIFTLPSAPSPTSSLMFFKNGQLLTSGSLADYTLSSATVTLVDPPEPDDTLSALYTYQLTVKSYSINEPVTVSVMNGVPTVALLNSPNPPETLMLFMNGQLLDSAGDFVLSGSSVTLNTGLRDIQESRFFATYTY